MISSYELYEMFREFFGKYFFFFDRLGTTIQYYVLDGKYNLFKDSGHLIRFMNNYYKDFREGINYKKETFDCDDFSMLFKELCAYYGDINGVAVFFDYDSGHAYNLVPTKEGIYIVEPQNMKVTTKREAEKEKLYKLKNGFLLI